MMLKTTLPRKTLFAFMLLVSNLIFGQAGSNDPTFNPTDIGNGAGDGANIAILASARQSDGAIVFGGGVTTYNGTTVNRIARVLTDGTLDPSFVTGSGANNNVRTIAIQSDGKILVGGDFVTFNGTNVNRLVRLNTNGSIDATFVTGLGFNSNVQTVSIQSDGKIVVGGDFTTYDGTTSNRIIRLNSDGSIDATFNIGTGASGTVQNVVIQTDGKIILGGAFTSFNGTGFNRLVRLNNNGSIDGTFTIGTGANAQVWSLALQADGKLLIGGNFSLYNGTTRNNIARLNSNGSLDATFNPGTGANGSVRSVLIQADGNIVLGGLFTTFNGLTNNYIVRLNSLGAIDGGFLSGSGFQNSVRSILQIPDGRLIVSGDYTSYNSAIRFRLARLNTDGTMDFTFNPNYASNRLLYQALVLPNDYIIAVGSVNSYNNQTCNRIIRLDPNGTNDPTFNPGLGADNTIRVVVRQNDGKLIVAGDFTTFDGVSRNRIARILPDGALDPTFNPGTGANAEVYTVSLQSNGKIIIGGLFTTYNGTPANYITRLNADGSLDASFVGTGTNGTVLTTSVQADDKIIVGGSFVSYNGSPTNYAARLNSDGSLDASFAIGTGFDGSVWSSAIQTDGKIILGGEFTLYNGVANTRIIRLNSDGSADAGFTSGTGANSTVNTIRIQSDGRILLGGQFTSYNGISRPYLTRILSDGNIDNVLAVGTGANGAILSIDLQSDNKIIIAGNFINYAGVGRNRIARIIVCPDLSPTFTPVAAICNGESLTALPTTSLEGLTGSWSPALDNTTTTLYTFTPDANQCAFSANMTIVVNQPATGIDVVTECDSYVWIDGNTYTTSNSTATYTIVGGAANGCDSTVTLNLTINSSSTGSETVIECDSYVWPTDGNTYTTSGTYTATVLNAIGCDSIVTLNLTINSSSTGSETVIECDSYVWPTDGNTYTSSGTYTATLTNAAGCDSTVILNLTIDGSSIPVATDNGDGTITASVGASYQWIDCGTGTVLVGETGQTLTVVANGSYASIVTNGACEDTSACVVIDYIGMNELVETAVQLMPNPTQDNITITMSMEYALLEVRDAHGKMIIAKMIVSGEHVDLSQKEAGLYFFTIKSENGSAVKRVVKN